MPLSYIPACSSGDSDFKNKIHYSRRLVLINSYCLCWVVVHLRRGVEVSLTLSYKFISDNNSQTCVCVVSMTTADETENETYGGVSKGSTSPVQLCGTNLAGSSTVRDLPYLHSFYPPYSLFFPLPHPDATCTALWHGCQSIGAIHQASGLVTRLAVTCREKERKTARVLQSLPCLPFHPRDFSFLQLPANSWRLIVKTSTELQNEVRKPLQTWKTNALLSVCMIFGHRIKISETARK